MVNIPELFGSNVFNDEVMQNRLPKDIYKSLKKTIESGAELDTNVASVVANAMKDWACEKGATHYTHWFQPMTGITAEKHDSFISPKNGKVIMEFSGKELIQGEPDASSFPSGGLRATFEARGYTAWDPTSYAFIKEDTLCIPTVFCSYTGEVLDNKTPLLRSSDRVSDAAMRILRLFGNTTTKRVIITVGPEQEYFLISKENFDKRDDLRFCGRTLFGAKPPKGQELEDHYFGALKPCVKEYMKELDEELWKLGIHAKTEHNEVAPSQHELATIFTSCNVSTDHNQLVMELMKKIALKHGLVCLLHEKPFSYINGSGKHNNWSISTDNGQNLLDPGTTPHENAQFLLFLMAVIKAVDENQDLLRISVASPSNDFRLGANEAPPAIISIFLGEQLTEILEAIEAGKAYMGKKAQQFEAGVHTLPHFAKDATDRNRTSPFAFTGNKFEFRMLGSAISVAGPNIVLNTIVASALDEFADKLEKASDFTTELNAIIKETIKNHKRIIFNGDGYSKGWEDEASKRGLLNLKSTVDALPYFIHEKNIHLFTKYNVFTKEEMISRCDILLENYTKTVNIEAETLVAMVKKYVIPATTDYTLKLANSVKTKKDISTSIDTTVETTLIEKLSSLASKAYTSLTCLESKLANVTGDSLEKAKYYHDEILTLMNEVRSYVDQIEPEIDSKIWSLPTYSDMLF